MAEERELQTVPAAICLSVCSFIYLRNCSI